MEENIYLEKVIPNIEGIPVVIKNGKNGYQVKKNTKFSRIHLHSDIEAICVYSGYYGVKLADETEYVLKAGDVIFFNANVAHMTYAKEDCIMKSGLIQFKLNAFKKKGSDCHSEILDFVSRHTGKEVLVTDDKEIFDLCDKAIVWSSEKNVAKDLFIASAIYGIIAHLYEEGFFVDNLSNVKAGKLKKLLPALEYISKEYSENISLTDVAGIFGMSNYYFCRLFKETLGFGYTDYLNFLRISKAQDELVETEKSILEIAYDNGFSSVSYFNRVFKSINNCSPSEYRKFSKESVKISNDQHI